MSDIFISYANEDREHARILASALEKFGWSVWWDRKIVTGQEYDRVIERELGSAKSVVVLWSSHSVASEWVKNEAAVAADRGVLLPAAIERIPAPLEFRRRQAADLVGWNGDSSSPGLLALHEGLSTIINAINKPPPQRDGPAPAIMGKRRLVMAGLAGALVVLLAGAYWMGRSSRGETQATGTEPVPSGSTRGPSQAPTQFPAGQASAAPGPLRPSPADPATRTSSTSVNLLSPENGGQLLLAPSGDWAASADGNVEQYRVVPSGEAVYGFKDGHRATFDSFGMLIPGSGFNPKEFELLVGDESTSGAFQSIGMFHPQDAKVFKTDGWQDFTFPPVTARYLKVKLRATSQIPVIKLFEFRLIGRLAADK